MDSPDSHNIEEYSPYKAGNILIATVGAALSHLIKRFEFFKLSEQQICTLATTLHIIHKLPLVLRNPPNISIEIHLPELAGYNTFNLTLEDNNLLIGCGGYDHNDLGGDSYSKEIVDINLLKFSDTVLVEEYDELNDWADVFVKIDSNFQLTIESNIAIFDESDLYNPAVDIDNLDE